MRKVKPIFVVVAYFLLVQIFTVLFFGAFYVFVVVEDDEKDLFYDLGAIVDSKAERIEDVVEDIKIEVNFISGSEAVREMFVSGGNSSDEELGLIEQNTGYDDFFLIDNDGVVVWTSEVSDCLGVNLHYENCSSLEHVAIYEKIEESLKFSILSFGYEDGGDGLLYVGAPVFDGFDMIGFIVLKESSTYLEDLVRMPVGMEEIGEIFIINEDLEHLTSLRYEDDFVDVGNGMGEVEGIDDCFKFYFSEEYSVSDNYAGKRVLRRYEYLPDYDWCVIAEVEESKFFEKYSDFGDWIVVAGISVGSFWIVFGLFFYISKKLNRRFWGDE